MRAAIGLYADTAAKDGRTSKKNAPWEDRTEQCT